MWTRRLGARRPDGLCGVSADTGQDIGLAVHEAVANVVEHAYPGGDGGTVTAYRRPGNLVVAVSDTGHWDGRRKSDTAGGNGLPLVRALTSYVAIILSSAGTTLRMVWPWPTGTASGSTRSPLPSW